MFRGQKFSAGRARMIFLQSIKKEPAKLALIAMRKKFSLASRALGLLYSYNCGANGRSYREIEFYLWESSIWPMHDISELSLLKTYLYEDDCQSAWPGSLLTGANTQS